MDYYRRPSSSRKPIQYQKKKSEWPHILLCYVLPFLVFNGIVLYLVIAKPRASLAVAATDDYLSTEVTLSIDSPFPVKSVTLTLDGTELSLTQDKHEYTTTVYTNGSLEATVVNFNGMPIRFWDHVNVLDDITPVIEAESLLDGILTVNVSDSQAGVDFDSIYAVNSLGETVSPLSIDRSRGTVTFEMDADGFSVYVSDYAGNQIQSSFSSRTEGEEEILEAGSGSADTDSLSETDGSLTDSDSADTDTAQTEAGTANESAAEASVSAGTETAEEEEITITIE